MFPQDWEQAQAGGVLATGPHAFDSDPDISDVDEDDRETLFSSMDVLSPGGHSDAQTLAMMLQEQLDAINEEIRYDRGQNPALPCAAMAPGVQQTARKLCWPKTGALLCLQQGKWLQDIQPQGLVLPAVSPHPSAAPVLTQRLIISNNHCSIKSSP